MYNKNWSRESLIELVEFILHHHRLIREKLLELQMLLQEDKSGSIGSLREFFSEFKTKLEDHFASEEQTLIPYIRQMDEFDNNRGPKPETHTGSIKNPISKLEYEHYQTENVMFDKIRALTGDFQIPSDSGDGIKAVYECLKDIVANLGEHIHLENNVLFPLAIELELRLMHKK